MCVCVGGYVWTWYFKLIIVRYIIVNLTVCYYHTLCFYPWWGGKWLIICLVIVIVSNILIRNWDIATWNWMQVILGVRTVWRRLLLSHWIIPASKAFIQVCGFWNCFLWLCKRNKFISMFGNHSYALGTLLIPGTNERIWKASVVTLIGQ